MTNKDEPIYPDKNYGNIGAIGLTKKEFIATNLLQGMVAKYGISDADWSREMTKRVLLLTDEFINQMNKNETQVES